MKIIHFAVFFIPFVSSSALRICIKGY